MYSSDVAYCRPIVSALLIRDKRFNCRDWVVGKANAKFNRLGAERYGEGNFLVTMDEVWVSHGPMAKPTSRHRKTRMFSFYLIATIVEKP